MCLYICCTGNTVVIILSECKESEYSGGQFAPVGGLAYYITAPHHQVFQEQQMVLWQISWGAIGSGTGILIAVTII
ncbi:hypothetical protein LWI28_028243 [Acer negundo]|uniref:Uncharacterized protein n=1 Tax=Acer negundo TaxID=4023 RepID=A0AAD5IC99_ACENE|nr:hypothetical protein LWI28_028243 [Acer negundo]